MKLNLSKKLGALLLAVTLTGVTYANPIFGKIDFAGGFTLETAPSVTTTSILAANGGYFSGVFVVNDTGAFSSVANGTSVTMANSTAANPWMFISGLVPTFWSVGGFTFDLASSNYATVKTNNFVNVAGVGTISDSDGTTTGGVWNFSVTDSTNGTGTVALFSFSSSTNTVPDGGTTAVLLGVALVGISVMFRRKSIQA